MTADDDANTVQNSKRIARYDEYFDLRTFSWTLRKTNKPVDKLKNKKPTLVIKRIIDAKGRHISTEINIHSVGLCEVLKEINEGVEGLKLNKIPPIASPWLFFYSRDGLRERLAKERIQDTPNDVLIADIETAFQFIHEDVGQDIHNFDRLTAHNEITYELLWALIPPNTLVYHFHEFTEQPQILLACSVTYRYPDDEPHYAEIACDVITDDGNMFGMARHTIRITTFTGARVIQDLVVYPLSFHREAEAIRTRAIQRGRRFTAMMERSCYEISGPAIQEMVNSREEVKWFKIGTYGRAMIDPASFRRFEPNRKFNFPVHRQLERKGLKDQQYMICNPVVLGFCFGIKKWGGFAIDRLEDVKWSDEPFEFLVLEKKQKMLIQALVRQHISQTYHFDDFIRGKGKGLIGLLSGRPGCGKTLSAEAIAEKTRRPLYVVSAGELGTTPKDVDERLTLILQLAHVWKAVLLLDEAEVFLQRRDFSDLTRNALVSIFLRQLEYYQGILILTTNLISHIDPAFESRIHFSIHYPDLDYNARRVIWRAFLDKTAKGGFKEEDLNRLAGYVLNGRQIKNLVGTAQAVALDSESPLSMEHVDAVLEVAGNWQHANSDMQQTAITNETGDH